MNLIIFFKTYFSWNNLLLAQFVNNEAKAKMQNHPLSHVHIIAAVDQESVLGTLDRNNIWMVNQIHTGPPHDSKK